MQLTLGISPSLGHDPGSNEDCPFCPVEKGKNYKTRPGAANNSDTLEEIMTNPKVLPQKQGNAWPHTGMKHPSREEIEGKFSHPDYGPYEFQAHHLISGKQALEGHKVEQWILKSEGKIEEDTGYTVNGSLNGLWAPSWPKNFRKGGDNAGEWTTSATDREEIAERIMVLASCQFHLGAHNIGDPDDPGQVRHERYDEWLKKQLTKINLRMWAWSRKCPVCEEDGERKDPPFQPNERINRALNIFSGEVRRLLTGPKETWFIFLSRLALEYHKKGPCDHPKGDERLSG